MRETEVPMPVTAKICVCWHKT